MPKFHFETIDGYTIEDPTGTDLPSEDRAKKLAEEMAKQIAHDVKDVSHTDVLVKTEHGEAIYKARIKSD